MGRTKTKEISPPVQDVMRLARVTTISELARWFGLPYGTVANWDKRGSVPEEHQARAIELSRAGGWGEHRPVAEPVGVSEATVFRYAAAQLPPEADKEIQFQLGSDPNERRYELIPRYETRVSAGLGHGEGFEDRIGEIAFELGWMQRNLGRSGRGFASVVVRGDSMQPALLNGDEIIIDKLVHRVDVNGIYVIALRGDLLVKRVQRMLDGSLVVRSDNQAYAPETLTAASAEDFRVVGRMVWPRVR